MCDTLLTAAALLLCFDICYRNSHAIITHHLSIRFGSKRESGFRDSILMSKCDFEVITNWPNNYSYELITSQSSACSQEVFSFIFCISYSRFISEVYLFTENSLNAEWLKHPSFKVGRPFLFSVYFLRLLVGGIHRPAWLKAWLLPSR